MYIYNIILTDLVNAEVLKALSYYWWSPQNQYPGPSTIFVAVKDPPRDGSWTICDAMGSLLATYA